MTILKEEGQTASATIAIEDGTPARSALISAFRILGTRR
jgi:hypothetical protein